MKTKNDFANDFGVEDLTVENIRKIREYEYQIQKNMTIEERVQHVKSNVIRFSPKKEAVIGKKRN